ncbi:GNAT family N-acetyltransferase [Photobacterium atrarenae]|uniref:GNAT family N-acetyltransferase n=1 Tax=Photobacterium atrarenae TaxID=865757 RepID=A0ABY5GPQ7_9GAMM|nr:GNAT family N-acetyltransferase [Photobacterium atrarenae]UTV30268.1 GNAT family N-acetyltransferase [Photobacterium atrarenae]
MEVRFLDNNANTDEPAVLEVLLQLRPSYDIDSLSAQIKKQQAHGYQVVYVKSPDGILAVAGFVVGEKLAWGKHIYIDDLVTNANHRSCGVGKFLIDWFKAYALEVGCEQIHLDSGVQRFPAHKFYLREGFTIASHHFSMLDVQCSNL